MEGLLHYHRPQLLFTSAPIHHALTHSPMNIIPLSILASYSLFSLDLRSFTPHQPALKMHQALSPARPTSECVHPSPPQSSPTSDPLALQQTSASGEVVVCLFVWLDWDWGLAASTNVPLGALACVLRAFSGFGGRPSPGDGSALGSRVGAGLLSDLAATVVNFALLMGRAGVGGGTAILV